MSTKSALAVMSDAKKELSYEGAKEMLLLDNMDDEEFLRDLIQAMVAELPAVKKKKTIKNCIILRKISRDEFYN